MSIPDNQHNVTLHILPGPGSQIGLRAQDIEAVSIDPTVIVITMDPHNMDTRAESQEEPVQLELAYTIGYNAYTSASCKMTGDEITFDECADPAWRGAATVFKDGSVVYAKETESAVIDRCSASTNASKLYKQEQHTPTGDTQARTVQGFYLSRGHFPVDGDYPDKFSELYVTDWREDFETHSRLGPFTSASSELKILEAAGQKDEDSADAEGWVHVPRVMDG